MHVQKIISAIFILSIFSCTGGGPRGRDDDDDAQRSGKIYDLEEVAFYDASPDISAAGDKVVFLSGREKSLKAFKYTRVLDDVNTTEVDESKDSKPSRVSDNDYGEEIEVAISGNGTVVAFVGNKDEVLDIYFTTFADGGTVHQLSDDTGVESNISFSPDSSYLLYSKRSNNSVNREVYVVPVAADGTPGESVKISGTDKDEFDPIWVPQDAAGSYRVVAKLRDDVNYSQSLLAHDFSTPASATTSTILSGAKIAAEKTAFTASKTGVYFSKPNPSSGADRIEGIKPAGNKKSSQKVQVSNSQYFLATSATSATAVEVLGFDILSISVNSAGSVGVWTVREAYLCDSEKDNDLRYRTSLILYDYTNQTLLTRIVPQKTKDESLALWVRTDDVCNNYIGDDKIRIDADVQFAKISADSTATNFQIAYSTFVSNDSEVRLLTSSTTGTVVTDKFYEVSNNEK